MSKVRVTIGLMIVLGGCAARGPVELIEATALPVAWEDLVVANGPIPDDGYALLTHGPTVGVFPLALAVARVTAVPAEDSTSSGVGHVLALSMEPRVDFLRWNSAFDDVRPISEVFPLSEIALGGNPVTVPNMISAARAMMGRACLIYSPMDVADGGSEIRGVLYPGDAQSPLAVIHARACAPLSDERTGEKIKKVRETGLPPLTPRGLAEERFRLLVRQCLLELLQNDHPAAPKPEEGWAPEQPPVRMWPPVPYESPYPDPYPHPDRRRP